MHERVELFSDGFDNARRAVAHIHHTDAAGKIEKPVSVYVFNGGAFGARCENLRGVRHSARDGSLPPLHPFLRFGAGYRCAQLNCGHVSTIRSAVRSN